MSTESERRDQYIATFTDWMRGEFDANREAKGGCLQWGELDPVAMTNDIMYHVAKLCWARRDGDRNAVREHLADIANTCLITAVADGLL